MKVLVVESPNKVKKIKAFLGDGWDVVASVGHIRDLPADKLGVDEDTLTPSYVFVPSKKGRGDKPFPGGKERAARIASVAKRASTVVLATDPDREGEAIAWHIQQALKLQNPERVTFGEITKKAVLASIAKPRKLDMDLVHAQEARRVLDRLVGYKVSRVISDQAGTWRTAGRVQSPAVRLVVDREQAIEAFKPVAFFGAELEFAPGWIAKWDPQGCLEPGAKHCLDRQQASDVAAVRAVVVEAFEDVEKKRGAPAPFTTSTLQQAASVKAKLRPKQTMDAAQRLFEAGAITYHRTDDPNLSAEAFEQLEAFAESEGLAVHPKRRRWPAKEGSQEAHEAIRPTDVTATTAGDSDAEQAVYGLIRARALAAVLPDAVDVVRKAELISGEAVNGRKVRFTATGRSVLVAGWRSVYAAGDDDDGDDAGNPVPALEPDQHLTADSGRVTEHKTKGPARYTEASLIKDMESRGIGRPSTYAAIMENIIQRGYISVDRQRKLHAEQVGRELIAALVGTFAFVDLDFTAEVEDQFDLVAQGKRTYRQVVGAAFRQLSDELGQLQATATPAHPCPACGKAMRQIRGGKGLFWGCSGYPECRNTLPDDDGKPGARTAPEPSKEYSCKKCGSPLTHRVKKGRGRTKGYDFWGCSGYPKCRETYESNTAGNPVFK